MTLYGLVTHFRTGAQGERIWIERDIEPEVGKRLRADDHLWLVRGPHIPADSDEPEPNVFDVELIE
jgi:hypothetical protein